MWKKGYLGETVETSDDDYVNVADVIDDSKASVKLMDELIKQGQDRERASKPATGRGLAKTHHKNRVRKQAIKAGVERKGKGVKQRVLDWLHRKGIWQFGLHESEGPELHLSFT